MPSYPASLPPADLEVAGWNHGQEWDEVSAALAALGTSPAGPVVTTVRDRIGMGGLPESLGLLAWSTPPGQLGAGTVGNVSGRQYFVRTYLPAQPVTNIICSLRTAGVGITAAAGCILDGSGNKVADTSSLVTPFGSTGLKVCALTTPYTPPAAGYYYIGWLCQATTTQPAFIIAANGDSISGIQVGLGATGAKMFMVDSTGRSAFLSSYTMSSLSPDNNGPWSAAS